MPAVSVIDRAFESSSQLRKRIFDAISATPQYETLFDDIAQYHLSSLQGLQNGGPLPASADDEQHASKKRKLMNGSLAVASSHNSQIQNQTRQVILEARDISFALPQRKKLHLGIAQYGTSIHDQETIFTLFTRNPATSEVEMEIPLDQFAYALRLPVPEKAAKQYNFCLLPKPDSGTVSEPIIFTVNHGPLKSCHISSPDLAKIAAGPDDVLETALDFVLQKSSGIALTYPTAEEFASAKPESHRKGDKAYHVKAFRGSKDGYLFFLQNGIFFGFKKPLSFFAFEDIESISYTSVLQRTFNLNIAYRQPVDGQLDPANNPIQEVEFSMLDQADFPGIDAYVKRHGLQDASLAESRRATKKANAAAANGKVPVDGTAAEPGDEEDTRTELEKAQQQLEDEEDEEEEDYDPGSDGESDGSGSEGESEEEAQYERKIEKKLKGRNLVAEELGSEAEDVSVTEDEGDGDQDEGDEDEGEHYEDEEHDQPEQTIEENGVTTSGPQHASAWGRDEDMPDPYDEDQL